jgi:hypothetical protein
MTTLIDTPNLADHDEFYAALLAAHKGLSESQSQALNAQLILILANHIGRIEPLLQALDLARRDVS